MNTLPISKHEIDCYAFLWPYLSFVANEQHYEVPDEFYFAVLGPYLKYSSGFWKDENTTLAESEIYMLDMYIERAGMKMRKYTFCVTFLPHGHVCSNKHFSTTFHPLF